MECAAERNKWYALFVMTGEEEKVKERLKYRFKNKDIKILLPMRRLKERKNGVWEDKIRVLFPGYILINGRISAKDYYLLKDIPGLLRALKDNYELLEITEKEMDVICRLTSNNEVIETSRVYTDGKKVVVIDGPLLGMEGFIESINKRKSRAKVRLNLFCENRVVELSVSLIQPLQNT